MASIFKNMLGSSAELFHAFSGSHRGDDCPCKLIKPSSSIWTAAQTNDIDTITAKMEQNPSSASKLDAYGYSALHYAAQHNHLQIVEMLLAKGCPVDGNSCGATPLHRAAYAGSTEACRLLLIAHADVNVMDTSFSDNATPLHKAYSGGHVDIVNLLLQHGANPTLLDAQGKCPEQLLKKKHYEKFGLKSQEDAFVSTTCAPETTTTVITSTAAAVATDRNSSTLDSNTTNNGTTNDNSLAIVPVSTVPVDNNNIGLECQQCKKTSISFARLIDGTLLCLDCKYNS